MVAFRKWSPAFAVAALSVASAFAQGPSTLTPLTCNTTAGVPPILRSEGITELVGDIVINCTGGDPTKPFNTNIQVFLNTQVTSRLIATDTYDALLMIDEPQAARLNAAGTAGTPTPFCPNFTGLATPTCNAAAPAETYQSGTFNVFRGSRVPGSSSEFNSVVWSGVPIVPPGSNRIRTIRITNLRANASGIGVGSGFIPGQVSAFVSSFPQGTLPLDNALQTVGYVQQGLLFDVRNCGNSGGRGSNVNAFQCQSRNQDRFNTPTSGTLPSNSTTSDTVVGLRFREGFQTAFKTRIAPGQVTSLPGQVFNSESGFVNTSAVPAGIGTNDGVADAGTRLMARFSGVPTGVRIFVTTTNVATVGSAGSAAVLVSTDPNGGTPNNTNPTSPAPIAPPGAINISCSGTNPAVEVPITNGTGMAVWEVTAADQTNLETLVFQAAYAYVANAGSNIPSVSQAQVTGTFAPLYTPTGTGSANATNPTFVTPSIPRFVAGTATAQNFFSVSQCATNLLFPFVTNVGGFDTGLAIANTSANPNTGALAMGNNANAGTCTLNYYGGLGVNNAPLTVTSETTDRSVGAGETLVLVLSGSGTDPRAYGLKGNPNMQGYIIAQCNFRFAHGFAFITDGPIGQARVAEGYLAIVLDGANTIRGLTGGEEQGH